MIPCNIEIGGRTITVRPVHPDDAAAWLHYLRRVGNETDFLAFSSSDVILTNEQAWRYLDYVSKKNDNLFLVAADQTELISTLHFQPGHWPFNRHRGEFGISVLADYWGNGLAHLMIQQMIEWAKRKGIAKINLKVRTDNVRAIQLYHSLGFVIEGTITRECLRQGVFFSAYHMGLKL